MAEAGRPPKPIDWELVDQLLEAGCDGVEVAAEFDMHPQTFYDRVRKEYGMIFTEYAGTKHSKGKGALRLEQHKKAFNYKTKGSTQMLIWLGKVRLGQREPEPIKEKPPNDDKIDSLLSQYKAPENQIHPEYPDAFEREATIELPAS